MDDIGSVLRADEDVPEPTGLDHFSHGDFVVSNIIFIFIP
jgi:hypothetical protein